MERVLVGRAESAPEVLVCRLAETRLLAGVLPNNPCAGLFRRHLYKG